MSRWTFLVFAGLLLASGPVSAQYIGIFMDPGASSCGASDVGPNPRIDLHVMAILGGSFTEFTGAQFTILGAPESWTPQNVLWVPDDKVVINIGHPMFPNPSHPYDPGVNVAFGACQESSASVRVSLGRIVLLGPPTGDHVRLRVSWFKLGSADPRCPFITNCERGYPKVCVEGGEIILNGPPTSSCPTAVEASTWTTVKRLYG